VEHAQQVVDALIDRYGYFGLFIGMALGNTGVPIGTELLLPVAGALTATGHLSRLWLTIFVALAGELGGGSVGYAIGRFGGVPAIERYGKYVHFTHARLVRVHAFFERWGSFAIFICRFLPVVRGISAIAAGIAEMNLALFYLWTFLGSLIFCTLLIVLGNALGTHVNSVLPLFHRGTYALLGLLVAICVAGIIVMRARARLVGAR
jgi:membrane protein DedA with SNARE-associated domain